MKQDAKTEAPPTAWWRVKTMWLVVGGPAAVVLAGVITAGIAISHFDPVVPQPVPAAK